MKSIFISKTKANIVELNLKPLVQQEYTLTKFTILPVSQTQIYNVAQSQIWFSKPDTIYVLRKQKPDTIIYTQPCLWGNFCPAFERFYIIRACSLTLLIPGVSPAAISWVTAWFWQEIEILEDRYCEAFSSFRLLKW